MEQNRNRNKYSFDMPKLESDLLQSLERRGGKGKRKEGSVA